METSRSERQPVHTVYGGAQRFQAGTASKLGRIARETFRAYLENAHALSAVTGIGADVAKAVHPRVAAKLEREPVEDFRIDFEDGYGYHRDAEEDAHAIQSALEVTRGMREDTLPPFIGIRIKALSNPLARRAARTLDLFLTTLLDAAGKLPPNFAVTLPKVTASAEVSALHDLLLAVETRYNLEPVPIELMIEAPQAIVNESGACGIPALLEAAGGRCRGMHFGPYDYTSSIGIASSHQSLSHPACDFARHMMQAATAGRGVFLSDGPTKLIPLGADRDRVQHAMRAHYDDVRRSLHHGFYQGWDLHPAQFPMRYAAVYAFFMEGLEAATVRLRNFMQGAAQATLLGTVFDDTASAQGLLNFFLKGWACGALTEDEIRLTGLTLDQLRRRSFDQIVASYNCSV